MVLLPDNTNTTLYKLNQIQFQRKHGRTIPMSRIGDPCHRRIWFVLHWAAEPEVISGKLQRIFNVGTISEEFIIEDLKRIGIDITNRQEELWGFMKHVHGYTDGRAVHVPEAPKTIHVVEIKTHNNKSFNDVVKNGVQKSKPLHYAQCQRYMGGLKLTRCLYIAYNKDTSDYYVERIRFDKSFYDDLLRKEREIILATDIPIRIFERSWHECKYCQFENHCYDGATFSVNCRTCANVDLGDEGRWVCMWNDINVDIPLDVQKIGCLEYKTMAVTR